MKNIPVVMMCVHTNGKVIPVVTARLLGNITDAEIGLTAKEIVQRYRRQETDCDWSQPRISFLYFGLAKRPEMTKMIILDAQARIEVTVLNLNPGENTTLEMFRPYQEFLVAARNSLLSGKSAAQTAEVLSISPMRIWWDGKITKDLARVEIEALAEALRADGYIDA